MSTVSILSTSLAYLTILKLDKIIDLLCVSVCAINEFLCDDTKCIQNELKCNNFVDCLDQTDEQNCIITPGKTIFISSHSLSAIIIGLIFSPEFVFKKKKKKWFKNNII